MRDSQKSKVYRAEGLVKKPDANERLETVEEIQAWINSITRKRWWRTYRLPSAEKASHRKYSIPYKSIEVRDGRARRNASGGFGVIKMPRWSRTKLIILHEVAHAIQTERPSHGRQFARIYLDLVSRFIGVEAATQLKGAYVAVGVRSGPKRPTTNPGDRAVHARLVAWRANAAKEPKDG